jgi:tetratricopeptide (TPR) repeat protein
MKYTFFIALSLGLMTVPAPASCQEQRSDTKGILREERSASAVSSTAPASSDQLRGSVQKQFPAPDDVDESDSERGGGDAASRLQAVISSTATAYDRLTKEAHDALVQGYLADSQKHYLDAIRELKKTGIKDLRLAKSRNSLGGVYLRDGKLLDARQAYELALKTANENNPPNVEVAKATSGLGCVAKAEGDYKKAEQYLKQSIAMREKLTGANDSGIAQSLIDLGECYRLQKLYTEGEPVYQLALETLNRSKNVPDLTKAYFLDKTGMFFHDQSKMPEARKCFAMSLDLKDKYSTLYAPVDGRKRGLVYYRCENGAPNAARVYNRDAEIEYLHVKDAVAVATLTAQTYASDWYLLKAEVTIQNQGKTAISACSEPPTLAIELPKRKVLSALDSGAIASELGARGQLMFDRLLHSADYAYQVSSFNVGVPGPAVFSPFGLGIFNTVGSWVTITPDWGARLAARNAAFSALGSAMGEGSTVFSTRPNPLTIGPGESATFQTFFPYERFDACTLRFLVGNTVFEFPFTHKSG